MNNNGILINMFIILSLIIDIIIFIIIYKINLSNKKKSKNTIIEILTDIEIENIKKSITNYLKENYSVHYDGDNIDFFDSDTVYSLEELEDIYYNILKYNGTHINVKIS